MGVDQALFQPFPSEVVFQQFQSQQTHQFPLNFRNNDQVSFHSSPHLYVHFSVCCVYTFFASTLILKCDCGLCVHRLLVISKWTTKTLRTSEWCVRDQRGARWPLAWRSPTLSSSLQTKRRWHYTHTVSLKFSSVVCKFVQCTAKANSVYLQDYHLELVCTTERERFVVPVRAVGVRALLDFPDDINFPASPVKVCVYVYHYVGHFICQNFACVQYPSSKTILVRSVGDQEAQFALHTKRYKLYCHNAHRTATGCNMYCRESLYHCTTQFCFSQPLLCGSNLCYSEGRTLYAGHCHIQTCQRRRLFWRADCAIWHW